ncbi:MAG: chemotaxis response regulator protein-glutamate methylesterase [Deltaproteobacteria bacterium]|nr:chemotaxis response regulator protein-glutamate methylesterase [Deltaproteobacteria bacterium]
MPNKKIRVLIIDDSAVVRQALSKIISSDAALEVMGAAADPFIAADKIREEAPDVITLDIEMPRMDGLTFLQKVMSQHPIPIVVISSLAEENSETALRAVEYGAAEIIQKPHLGIRNFLEEGKILICDAVKAAATAKLRRIIERRVSQKLTADVVIAKARTRAMAETTNKVAVIGASTGGTEAIRDILEAMPLNSPGLVIVQHMPEHFTAAFARRLDGICRISVKEAETDDTVVRGRALIAPGNKHLLLKRSGARYYVEVKDGPLVSRHRPSVDVLFRSAAQNAGKNAVGVIMTGMGDDGARGMAELHEAGARCVAQNEDSCVVFGMPREAIKRGAVDAVLPLSAIPDEIIRQCG